ncbi:hypothetical protein AYL99_11000 [Fonsecaea erecta]|uniref:Uncharacterized protein n=1 Tax=Fonsecaea erecta TaxID=1367422 RepID=A0A178Z494_9EURO|nr:hypothetical protein AYL99_11000 [Fonsecaea erecta]OAP54552.1 hypothetical protein AYL99_11000 [Fonsecaea erecta]
MVQNIGKNAQGSQNIVEGTANRQSNYNSYHMQFICNNITDVSYSSDRQELQEPSTTESRPMVLAPVEPVQLYEVPHSRNTRFCGRRRVLDKLHELLANGVDPSGTAEQLHSCVIHGMGGVGKTQVAIEYTYRHRRSYDFIFWIKSENEAVFANSITQISTSLCLGLAETLASARAVEAVRKWFENSKKRWLLVFDNAETWDILEPCVPRSNHGAVLITSQNDQLGPHATVDIPLRSLNSTEGSELILRYLPNTGERYEVEDAKKISAQLGGLPLALGFAAGFISQTKWSLQEFLNYSEGRRFCATVFKMDPPAATHPYKKTLAGQWEESSQRLTPEQLRIIHILSMLDPDDIPEGMLYAEHHEQELDFLSSSKITAHDFGTMLGALTSWHLIDRESIGPEARLLIHRTLQKNVLHSLDKDHNLLQHTFRLTFTLVRKVYPKQSPTHDPQNDHWKIQALYQPHVLSLHSVYENSTRELDPFIEFAELLSDAAYYLWEKGMLANSSKLTDTAEEICERCPDAPHVIKANVYSLGAALRWSRGITVRASILRRFLQALAHLQKHINKLDPEEAPREVLQLYATSWSDVGHVFIEHEFYEEALECLGLCESIKKGLGDELGLLGVKRARALTLAWLGRFGDALELIPDEDKLPRELLAPGSASFFERCRYAWANVLVMTEDLNGALKLLKENLKCRKLLYGETGHYTLDSSYLLGVVHQKMGNTQLAIDLFKRAIQFSANWSEESTILAKHQLSKAFAKLGQHETALIYSTEADEVRKRLWDSHATYIDSASCGNDDETYDHLASCETGRVTVGKFQATGKLPKLMEICRDIQKRLNAVSGASILPSTFCEMCKSPEIDVSEAEIYT